MRSRAVWSTAASLNPWRSIFAGWEQKLCLNSKPESLTPNRLHLDDNALGLRHILAREALLLLGSPFRVERLLARRRDRVLPRPARRVPLREAGTCREVEAVRMQARQQHATRTSCDQPPQSPMSMPHQGSVHAPAWPEARCKRSNQSSLNSHSPFPVTLLRHTPRLSHPHTTTTHPINVLCQHWSSQPACSEFLLSIGSKGRLTRAAVDARLAQRNGTRHEGAASPQGTQRPHASDEPHVAFLARSEPLEPLFRFLGGPEMAMKSSSYHNLDKSSL